MKTAAEYVVKLFELTPWVDQDVAQFCEDMDRLGWPDNLDECYYKDLRDKEANLSITRREFADILGLDLGKAVMRYRVEKF